MEEYVALKSLNYQFGINKHAQVINLKTGRMISPYIGIDNYQHVALCMNGRKYRKRVHRLMAEAFLNNCKVVDHIDGNKSNNELSNLRAVTHSENIKKAYQQNKHLNPHKGRGVWIIAQNKKTKQKKYYKSMRSCQEDTGIDRHRIKTFLDGSRRNLTQYNFYYDE